MLVSPEGVDVDVDINDSVSISTIVVKASLLVSQTASLSHVIGVSVRW